ncbi:MAG: NAD(P)-binding domain-containing protein [Uliginosibacterium sp.]|nr:NAD(P)-binding domain-containing protein [Uliginosibacterium sp.]
MFDSIGFIGAGRIAHIMLAGWQHAGTALPRVVVFDTSAEALASLQAAFPQVQAGSLSEVASQALVFAALHPPAMGETLAQIRPALRSDAVLCSLAPRLGLTALQEKLGGFGRLARMNPNATSVVAQGYNPIALGDGLPADARAALLALLTPLGQTPEVPDALIETYAVVSAMGPTYFWFQFDALRQQAEAFGLSPADARDTLRAMLHGAVDTLFASELSPARVMDLVPVRPLADSEAAILAMQRQAVGAIHAKLHA